MKEELSQIIKAIRGLLHKSGNRLGVEISLPAVKMLELSAQGSSYRVENFALAAFDPEALLYDEIKDAQTIKDTISTMHGKFMSKDINVATAVPASLAVIKQLTLDANLSEIDIETKAWLEAEKAFPKLVEEVNLDFAVLGPTRNEPSKNEVLLVACRKEHIESRVALLNEIGIQVKVVDVDYYAIVRALTHLVTQLPDKGTDQTVAVLNLGTTTLTLIVLDNLQFLYSYNQAFDGQGFIAEVEQVLGAENLIVEYSHKIEELFQSHKEEVAILIRRHLVTNIRRFLQLFYSTNQGVEIHHVFLAGECALIPEIEIYLSELIGLSASVANPFLNMPVAPDLDADLLQRLAPVLLQCFGLATHRMLA